MPTVSRTHWTLLAVSIAGVSFAAILARWALGEGVAPIVVAFYRLLFATLMLLPFTIRSVRIHGFSPSRRDMAMMAAVGFLLAAHFATWITSLEYTSVASSVVIVATESLWVPLGAAFLLREHVGARVWAGVFIAFGGSVILLAGDLGETRFAGNALVGDFLAFAGALAASMYFLAGRRIRQRFDLLPYATIVYAFCAAFLLVMAYARGDVLAPHTREAYGYLLLFAFFPMILGHTLINYLLKWVPPHFISTSILAEPVVSALLAVVLLQEGIRPLVLVGGIVILAGIVVATSRARQMRAPVSPMPPG